MTRRGTTGSFDIQSALNNLHPAETNHSSGNGGGRRKSVTEPNVSVDSQNHRQPKNESKKSVNILSLPSVSKSPLYSAG